MPDLSGPQLITMIREATRRRDSLRKILADTERELELLHVQRADLATVDRGVNPLILKIVQLLGAK